jgi:transcription antitermination factor NusG
VPEGILSDWFVVRTQPRRERWAAENVARAGYTYYLPEIMETIRSHCGGVRRREFQVKPLFPSYLFAQAEHGQWHELLRTFGVVALVQGAGGAPGMLRASAMATIRAWENNGVVELPTSATGFQPNQRVTITSGAYAGFTGLVQGNSASERIQVLLDYMGRKVPFLVREAHLEAAA